MTLKEMMNKRAGLVVQMRSLLDKADKAERDLNTEEKTQYDNLEKEVDALTLKIDRENRLAVIENNLRNRKDHDYRPNVDGKKSTDPKNRAANGRQLAEGYGEALFNGQMSYARVGKNGLSAEFTNVLNTGTDAEGGYLVPEEFETQLQELLVNADPIRAAATVIRTASDRNIPIETDTGSFAYIAESGAYPTSDPAIGRVILSAFKSGGIIKVSEELLQDSAFDLESYLQRLAGRRYNALEQTNFANGDGAGKPMGLFQTASVAGQAVQKYTGAVSASPAITTDDLIETFHKLDRAYRDNAIWLTSDAMVKMIRKLKDSTNQYLWQPGLVAGQPDRLLNRPIMVSDGAPVPAVSGKSIVFGDMSFYYIVDRLGLSMQRLNEVYAVNGQVGFKFTKRNDGRLTSHKAIVHFEHGAAA